MTTNEYPAYLPELIDKLRAELSGGPGVCHIHVYHDDDCAIWHGGVCDCKPDVRTETPAEAMRND